MNHRMFELVSSVVFLLIAIGHVIRVLLRAPVVAEGFTVPVWWSAVIAVFFACLAWQGFRLWRASAATK